MSYFKDLENKLHYLDDDSYVNLLPTGSLLITDEERIVLLQPTDAQLLLVFKAEVKNALSSTSVTMERIVEGVSLGTTTLTTPDVVAWMDYRKALRDCLTATEVISLPLKPAYPAGT